MEKYLKRFRPRNPRPGLKDSILKAAEAELSITARNGISLIDRIWSSRLSWATAACSLLFLLIFNPYLDKTQQDRLAKIYTPALTAKESEGDNLVRDLIALLGMKNGVARRTQALWEVRLREPTLPLNLNLRQRIISDELKGLFSG